MIELVLPQGEEPFFGKWLDLHMLVMLGARERTEAEYAHCFLWQDLNCRALLPRVQDPVLLIGRASSERWRGEEETTHDETRYPANLIQNP